MRVQVLLPVTIVVSLILFGLIKVRRKARETEEKHSRFQDIKLRVSHDVLTEYETEITNQRQEIDRIQAEQKTTVEETHTLNVKADETKGKVDICEGDKKNPNTEHDSNTEVDNLKEENDKEMAEWKKEVVSLKDQLKKPSAVCQFLKGQSKTASKLCAKEDSKEEEAPNKEEAKKEASKKEEAKEEAPKKEEAKEEAPKKEEAKEEAPKKEEAKEEAPKKEEAR
nr:PREDICTED: neurofilament heavy polypeptide-like [Paralichthys olivaceus]